jgi:hypothetical protein
MVRIKNFFTWPRGGPCLTSGYRNLEIAAHGTSKFMPDGGTVFRQGDGGTVLTEQAGITETPEERSRRLKRERDRCYKANKKAKEQGVSLPGQTAFV